MSNRTGGAEVVVVGAGHNGLVAACYLAKAGLDVLVVERWGTPGGMTSTNPMAPEAPDHLINEASIHASLFRTTKIDAELELSSRFGLRQRVIDPAHVHINPDGESIAMWRDPMRTVEEIRRFSRRDAQKWVELSNIIARATAIGLPMMQTSPVKPEFAKVREALKAVFAGRKELREIMRWVSISQAQAIEEHFEHPMVRGPLTVNLPFMHFHADLSGWASDLSRRAPEVGRRDVRGRHRGIPRLPDPLSGGTRRPGALRCAGAGAPGAGRARRGSRAGRRRGHQRRTRCLTACGPIDRAQQDASCGHAVGASAARRRQHPDDLDGMGQHEDQRCAERARSSLPRHQAWRAKHLSGDPVDLRLPCVTWSTHEQSLEAGELAARGEVPKMIPGLSQVTTAFDPTMAPDGHDTWWFWSGLVPASPNEDWDSVRRTVEQRVLRDCAQYYDGLESFEIARRTLVPKDLETRFGAPDGNVYHVDPIVSRFGPSRPAIGLGGYKTPVPGLYLSGSGTHPIAGINGMPGMNAAKVVIKDLKKQSGGAAATAQAPVRAVPSPEAAVPVGSSSAN